MLPEIREAMKALSQASSTSPPVVPGAGLLPRSAGMPLAGTGREGGEKGMNDTLFPDIRWQQRLSNYEKALASLAAAVELAKQRVLSDLEKQGIIQAFEFTHELAWNVMKDYFYYQGNSSITGSRDATREAYGKTLIVDGEGWMEMIMSRNKTFHTYNQAVAEEIAQLVVQRYYPLFQAFMQKMQSLETDRA